MPNTKSRISNRLSFRQLFDALTRSPAGPYLYLALAVIVGAAVAHFLPDPWGALLYRVIFAAVEVFIA